MDENQRQRILRNTSALHGASDALARTQAVSQETGNDIINLTSYSLCVVADDIAVDVMGELHNQRAALIRTKDRVSKE